MDTPIGTRNLLSSSPFTRSSYENFETFMARCEVFFPHAEVVRISGAYDLAKGHHAHQTRKDEKNADGTPVRYFEHVRRVALILLDEAHLTLDPDLVILALLHDAYEDTRLGPEVISLFFGSEISRRVMLMSKKPKQGFRQRLEMHGDWKVLAVKVADRIDNLRTLGGAAPEFKAKQIRESLDMYTSLSNLMVQRATPESITPCEELRRIFLRTLTEISGT